MAESNVIIVGGGVGGVVTARQLRWKLGNAVRVTLVDKQNTHLFQPSLLWLMTGKRKPESITRSLSKLERKGIEVVQAEVTTIDPARKTVMAGEQEISGDYLVMSPGVDLAPETVPGLAEAGHNLYTLKGAEHIRDERLRVTSGQIVVLVARTPFKCPAAPYEAAMLLQDDLKRRGLTDTVSVALYSPEPGPMPVTGPENSAQVRAMVEASGVRYFPQHTVASVDPTERRIKFQDGAEAEYSLLVYVPPHSPPRMLKDSGLTGESGWVTVDPHSMETKFPDVFAIGDVTMIPLQMGLPLPKAGTFAQGQAKAVAATIARRVKGKGQEGQFDGFGECFIESGGGRAGMGSGNFYAEPVPQVALKRAGRRWHWGKVMFERWWLWRWL